MQRHGPARTHTVPFDSLALAEKQVLAGHAGLSLKQVNDWFTNYRKRHWEDEMFDAKAVSDELMH